MYLERAEALKQQLDQQTHQQQQQQQDLYHQQLLQPQPQQLSAPQPQQPLPVQPAQPIPQIPRDVLMMSALPIAHSKEEPYNQAARQLEQPGQQTPAWGTEAGEHAADDGASYAAGEPAQWAPQVEEGGAAAPAAYSTPGSELPHSSWPSWPGLSTSIPAGPQEELQEELHNSSSYGVPAASVDADSLPSPPSPSSPQARHSGSWSGSEAPQEQGLEDEEEGLELLPPHGPRHVPEPGYGTGWATVWHGGVPPGDGSGGSAGTEAAGGGAAQGQEEELAERVGTIAWTGSLPEDEAGEAERIDSIDWDDSGVAPAPAHWPPPGVLAVAAAWQPPLGGVEEGPEPSDSSDAALVRGDVAGASICSSVQLSEGSSVVYPPGSAAAGMNVAGLRQAFAMLHTFPIGAEPAEGVAGPDGSIS